MDNAKESDLREEAGGARCTCPDTARLLTAYLAGRGREVSCTLHRPTDAPANPPVPLNSEQLETQLIAALTNH